MAMPFEAFCGPRQDSIFSQRSEQDSVVEQFRLGQTLLERIPSKPVGRSPLIILAGRPKIH